MKTSTCALIFASLLLATCGGPPVPTLTPTPSPDEWLDRAAQAVLAMTSAKFTLVREGAPAVLDPQTNTTFTEASGQYQAPDRVSATLKVSVLGNVVSIEMLWLPEGNYVSNPFTGAFGEAPAEAQFNGAALFKADGIPAVLSDGLQNTTLVGAETIEDVETLHLSGEADGAKLAPLTAGALAAGTLYPVDVWIETATANLVRLHITEPDGNGWLIDVFDIGQPVDIKTP
jgi:hypothetical protein